MAPEKDSALKKAIKATKVMTVRQHAVGTKADHGIIGFEPGKSRLFLVFPKSLSAFAGKTIVGIKYGLLNEKPRPKAKRAEPPRARKPSPKRKTSTASKEITPEESPTSKVIAFQREEPDEEENEEVAELKAGVRRAMKALEEGKQVAAFNLLKHLIGD